MPVAFPSSPSIDDLHVVGAATWRWDGLAWVINAPINPQIGVGFWFCGQTPPPGALVRDGSVLLIADFPELFAAIGNIWTGGDGITTFALPDARGRHSEGALLPEDVGGYVAQSIQSHAHGVNDPTHAHAVADPGHLHSLKGNAGGSLRALNSQTDRIAGISDGGSFFSNPGVIARAATGIGIFGAATGISIQAAGGATTRPASTLDLPCIWYE